MDGDNQDLGPAWPTTSESVREGTDSIQETIESAETVTNVAFSLSPATAIGGLKAILFFSFPNSRLGTHTRETPFRSPTVDIKSVREGCWVPPRFAKQEFREYPYPNRSLGTRGIFFVFAGVNIKPATAIGGLKSIFLPLRFVVLFSEH